MTSISYSDGLDGRLSATRRLPEHQRRWLRLENAKWKEYKKSARIKELDFALSRSQFNNLISAPCHYCGRSPDLNQTNGIDRKRPDRGYIATNSVSCCATCNRMKWAFSVGQFLHQIRKIYSHSCKLISRESLNSADS